LLNVQLNVLEHAFKRAFNAHNTKSMPFLVYLADI